MWYENLENSKFIKSLYINVPQIVNVRIAKLEVLDEGNRVSISFDMPCYPDKIPKKWENEDYNTVFISLDFFSIHHISMNSSSSCYIGSLDVQEKEDGLLAISIKGTLNLEVIAESGLVQSVRGYYNDI